MLTRSGVKLLDFGLAKEVLTPGSPSGSDADTLTRTAAIVGTPQYMAPEQLAGKQVDARTDIFAFGAVLYELVTGRKAFEGTGQASVIVALLEHEPAGIHLHDSSDGSVPAIERTIRKALAKNPDDRWQTVRDLKHELQWIATGDLGRSVPSKPTKHPRWMTILLSAMAAGLLTIIAFASLHRSSAPQTTVRFAVPLPDTAVFTSIDTAGTTPQMAVSPDGRMLVFAASQALASPVLWVRPLDAFSAQPLPTTEGASFPFWSPDSRRVGFFAAGKLKVIDIDTRSATVLTDAPAGRGGTWNRGETILFAGGISSAIKRISAAGGTPVAATTLDASRNEISHRFPQFLPDGRHFIYSNIGSTDHLGVYLTDLDGAAPKRILPGKWGSPSIVGEYLLAVRQGSLIAQPFDGKRLAVSGAQFRIADQVASNSPSGFAAFSASNSGTLIYASGSSPNRELVWLARNGHRLGSLGPPGEYASPALRSDGRMLAVTRIDSQTRTPDIWLLDLERGTETRLTSDPGSDRAPLWTADGRQILFQSDRSGTWDLYIKSIDVERPETLFAHFAASGIFPSDVTADGQFVIFHTPSPNHGWDLWVLPLREPSKSAAVLQTRFDETYGTVSPDGHWIAYACDDTGTMQVYVQSFPNGGHKVQASVHGGYEPKWNPTGDELFFISPTRKLMSVKVRLTPSFDASMPTELFDLPVPEAAASFPNTYVVASRGDRFLVNTALPNTTGAPISVVLNWSVALRR